MQTTKLSDALVKTVKQRRPRQKKIDITPVVPEKYLEAAKKEVSVERAKSIEQPQEEVKSKDKKKRTVDPSKMTYIKAMAIWKKQQEPVYKGVSPKKGSKQYDEIMKIMKDGK